MIMIDVRHDQTCCKGKVVSHTKISLGVQLRKLTLFFMFTSLTNTALLLHLHSLHAITYNLIAFERMHSASRVTKGSPYEDTEAVLYSA
jgi:hypothetical protein